MNILYSGVCKKTRSEEYVYENGGTTIITEKYVHMVDKAKK
ncbi:hypothetical protein MHI39_12525 [Heyndrickxia sp. FSL K6-6286]